MTFRSSWSVGRQRRQPAPGPLPPFTPLPNLPFSPSPPSDPPRGRAHRRAAAASPWLRDNGGAAAATRPHRPEVPPSATRGRALRPRRYGDRKGREPDRARPRGGKGLRRRGQAPAPKRGLGSVMVQSRSVPHRSVTVFEAVSAPRLAPRPAQPGKLLLGCGWLPARSRSCSSQFCLCLPSPKSTPKYIQTKN